MGNSLVLTMYRKTPHADSQVELFDSDGGFLLYGFPAMGDPTLDEYDTPIRTLAFTFLIRGTNKSQQDMIDKADRVQGMLMRTARYIGKQKGNLTTATDGTWHEGHAASAIFWPMGAATPVYYDVMGGSIALKENFTDVKWGQAALACVITLTIRSDATKDQRTLDNLVACGDFAPPFSVYDPAFTAGWSYGTPANWSVSTEQAWWGDRSLKAVGSSSDFFASNGNAAVVPGDVLVPALMVYVTAPLGGGTIPCALEYYNGSDWTTIPQDTFATLPTLPSGATLQPNTWTPVVGAAITLPAGTQQVRLAAGITSVATTTGIYFDGVAIWRNPLNSQKPDEYVTGGYSLGMPHLNVYGVKGDSDAPALLSVFPVSNTYLNGYLGDTCFIGCQSVDTQADLPLSALDFRATAPQLREMFSGVAAPAVAESGHVLTVVQGNFGTAGGSLVSTSDADGDALWAGIGPSRYTTSIYINGTLNSATNFRIPQITIGTPQLGHAHFRIYLNNGNLYVRGYDHTGAQVNSTNVATTTADNTAYQLTVQTTYASASHKVTVSVNGTALITAYALPIMTVGGGAIDPVIYGNVGVRLAKGGSPATAASWDAWTAVPETGSAIAPGEIPQTTDTAYLWGGYAYQSVSSSGSLSATFVYANGAGIGHRVDRYARTYRAVAVFQSDTPTTAVGRVAGGAVTLNSEARTYLNLANSQTYPAATQTVGLTFIDMGDFEFGRPGNMWHDLIEGIDAARSAFTLTNTGLNSTGYAMRIAGIVLLPVEQFAKIKSVAKTYGFLLNSDGEQSRAGNYDINNFFATGIRPEQVVPHDNMVASGGEFTLPPAIGQRSFVTRFEIMPVFSAPDNTYVNAPQTQYHVSLKYQPHYSLGVG